MNDTALSTDKSHPAQLDAFIQAYRYLLESGVEHEGAFSWVIQPVVCLLQSKNENIPADSDI
jgi:hypothetical protein